MSVIITNIKNIIPGLFLCVCFSLLAIYFAKFFPAIGAAPIAIFLGMIGGNTFANGKKFEAGSKFSESDLLAYSIVLLGGTLSIKTIFKLGYSGIIFIMLQMLLTIIITMYIGKRLGFSKRFSALMSCGNAVCGSSAIGAASPVVNAENTEKGITITIVNLTGTILMFALIPIVSFLFHFETVKSSALVGGTLQSVGQVIAAGNMLNAEILEMATIFKIVRIIFLILVIIWLSREFKVKNLESDSELFVEKEFYTKQKAKISVPWYIIGFFILCTLFSLGLIPTSLAYIFKAVSGKFEIVALAGIGMRVKLAVLLAQGPKASLYGILVGICQVTFAIILIKLFL